MVIDRIAFAHSTFTRACLVGLLAWQASSAALAADEPLIGSSTASITGLQFQVIDLNPAAGNTPWVKFASDLNLSHSYVTVSSNGSQPDGLVGDGSWQYWAGTLPTSMVSEKSSDGLAFAQATPTSLSASSSLPATWPVGNIPYTQAGLAASAIASAGMESSILYSGSSTTIDSQGRVLVSNPDGVASGSGIGFTLSAHTSLVLRGHATVAYSFNPELSPWPIDLSLHDNGAMDLLVSLVSISAGSTHPQKSLDSIYDNQTEYSDALVKSFGYADDGISVNWNPEDPKLTDSLTKDMVVTFTNDSDVDVEGTFMVTALANLRLSAAAAPSPVPEPGTPFMVGLGLAVVLAWRRRTSALV
jgi:hypothetical protein